ncbi:hydrogenase nickel incorporation protein HypB [Nitrospira sp. MA-1]|nr:hydrogenase nickel incorporation protein HypB [Nitrospira sp. MA-1]
MCTTCGCSDSGNPRVTNLQTGPTDKTAHSHSYHSHSHGDHDHHHEHGLDTHHDHQQGHETTVHLEQAILEKNDRLAERNREWFLDRNIVALNLVSSPGSGKTTLLERTIHDLKHAIPISVIEGDQETVFDAERIRKAGCPVVQINTGTGCHLEADMLARGMETLQPPSNSLVLIENVGNLVCPALFDLGEQAKVVVFSVTEGEDKPLKYPHMFQHASVMILNKIDLLPHLTFDVKTCLEFAHKVNPKLQVFQLSAITGEGLQHWYDWVTSQIKNSKKQVIR